MHTSNPWASFEACGAHELLSLRNLDSQHLLLTHGGCRGQSKFPLKRGTPGRWSLGGASLTNQPGYSRRLSDARPVNGQISICRMLFLEPCMRFSGRPCSSVQLFTFPYKGCRRIVADKQTRPGDLNCRLNYYLVTLCACSYFSVSRYVCKGSLSQAVRHPGPADRLMSGQS